MLKMLSRPVATGSWPQIVVRFRVSGVRVIHVLPKPETFLGLFPVGTFKGVVGPPGQKLTPEH